MNVAESKEKEDDTVGGRMEEKKVWKKEMIKGKKKPARDSNPESPDP